MAYARNYNEKQSFSKVFWATFFSKKIAYKTRDEKNLSSLVFSLSSIPTSFRPCRRLALEP